MTKYTDDHNCRRTVVAMAIVATSVAPSIGLPATQLSQPSLANTTHTYLTPCAILSVCAVIGIAPLMAVLEHLLLASNVTTLPLVLQSQLSPTASWAQLLAETFKPIVVVLRGKCEKIMPHKLFFYVLRYNTENRRYFCCVIQQIKNIPFGNGEPLLQISIELFLNSFHQQCHCHRSQSAKSSIASSVSQSNNCVNVLEQDTWI